VIEWDTEWVHDCFLLTRDFYSVDLFWREHH
jgi:hypothetical protein